MENHKYASFQSRLQYIARRGDTPRSVAQQVLGDVRFADLLITINRVNITYDKADAGMRLAFIPESKLLLPSITEMEIYSRHYFDWHIKALNAKPVLENRPSSIQTGLSHSATAFLNHLSKVAPLQARKALLKMWETTQKRPALVSPQKSFEPDSAGQFAPRYDTMSSGNENFSRMHKILSDVRYSGGRSAVQLHMLEAAIAGPNLI